MDSNTWANYQCPECGRVSSFKRRGPIVTTFCSKCENRVDLQKVPGTERDGYISAEMLNNE